MCLNCRMAKNRRTVKKSRTARKRQNGGVAPVSYSIPFGQRQPTEAIMERATTAGGGARPNEDTNPSEVTMINNRAVNNSTIQTNPSQVNVANLTKSPPVSYLKNTTLKKQYEKENFKEEINKELYGTIMRIVSTKTNNHVKSRININWSDGPSLIIKECLENKIPVNIAKDILLIYIKSYKKFTEPLRIIGYSEEKALNYANNYAIQEATKAINNYKNGNPLKQGLLNYNITGKPLNQVPLNVTQPIKQTPTSTSFFSKFFSSVGGKYKRTHHKRANRKHTHRNKRN